MSAPKLIWHGSYAAGTVYNIIKHRYGLTDCESRRQGYAEVLEIKDEPEGRCRNIIHVFYNDTGSVYHEFKYIEDALAAYHRMLNTSFTERDARDKQGYIRTLKCEDGTPWFYDVDEEAVKKLQAKLEANQI